MKVCRSINAKVADLLRMAEEAESSENSCKILELPHCVLTLLFSYLDTTSLYQLTRTSEYLKSVIEVPLFWRYIDARKEPNTDDKVEYCTDRIHEKTTHVLFKAKDRNSGRVPSNFFETINPFVNLRVLVLENQRFNGSKLSLKDFPTGLEELSLKKTDIKCAEYFFQQSDKTMRKLRVLILDGCKWVTSSFFMSVAKYENLEIVSAIKCLRLHLDMVPYLSVARLHCKNLKVFDCRFTGIGHELLRSFYSKEALQCLYFQSLKSTELDYSKKIFNNSYMRTITYPSEFNRMDSIICDESLLEYINCIASDSTEPMPHSLLYKDPYPSCTCNYKGQERDTKTPQQKIMEDYYLCESRRQQLMKFVCQGHFADVQKLPNEFKEFFVANQKQFYTDINSDVDSDPESSDSEGDTSCCMYGMGRKMILLTPGSNRELHQEILELNRDDRKERPNFNIFIASPLGENRSANAEPERAVASTSRSVSDNSINENIENAKHEAKRGHSDGGESPEGKKRKLNQTDDDDVHAAKVDELVESAVNMENKLKNFIQTSMDTLPDRSARCSWQQAGPSTSRAEEGNLDHPREAQCSRSDNNPSTSHLSNVQIHVESPLQPSGSSSNQIDSNRATINPPGDERNADRRFQIFCERRCQEDAHNQYNLRRNQMIGILARVASRERASLAHDRIKKKLSLHRLSLRGFRRITDAALDCIKNLNLDLLDLTYTSVTEQGIEGFLINNPNCRVVHPLYCVCKPVNPFE